MIQNTKQFADDSFSDDDLDIVSEIEKTQLNTQTLNYQLQGQIAVLENQLAELRKSQFKREDDIKEKFKRELNVKDLEIQNKQKELKERDTQIELWKDKDEFKAIDENLNSLKRRKLNDSQLMPTPPRFSSSSVIMDVDIPPKDKIMVLNQTSWYEDERSTFTESISSYVIPGTQKPVLEYLSDITSKFDYEYCGFKMVHEIDNFKSIILKFLIEFDDKHRLDLLISNFINFIFNYISKCLIPENNCLLQVIFLLPLMNFSLNYRPKAISDDLIQFITKEVTSILQLFPDIISSEINYLSTSDSKNILEYIQSRDDDIMDYSFLEKPIHIKILEIFCSIYSINILESLAQLASFRMENFINCKAAIYFWKNIQPKLFYSLLQPLTTFQFIQNGLNILISSTFDNSNFAFTFKKDRNGESINFKIVTYLITLFDESLSKNKFNITGLNQSLGFNSFTKLIELISPLQGEKSSLPRTHPIEKYNEIILGDASCDDDDDEIILEFKIKLINLFEILISMNESINFNEFHDEIFKKLTKLIDDEQTSIFKSPRSINIGKRVKIICKSILLIKFLINDLDYPLPMQSLNGKLFIISILRVSSNNMRDISLNFLKKVRSKGYEGTIFNSGLEDNMLDKFGALSKDFKLELEMDLINGIEFDYPMDIIDTCKDMLIDLIGEQDSDKLTSSINYDLPNFDLDQDDVDM